MLVLGLTAAFALVSAPAVVAQEPDIELLEYLGSWQTEDGSVVDPFELDEAKDLEPELGGTEVKTSERTQQKVTDRSNEGHVRKPGPAPGVEMDSKRREASPGGGHD